MAEPDGVEALDPESDVDIEADEPVVVCDTSEALDPGPVVDIDAGEFVVVCDTSVASWFGRGAALVLKKDPRNSTMLAVVGSHWPFQNRLRITNDTPVDERLPYRAFWINQSQVRPHSVVINTTFRFDDLPVTAVAVVLSYLSLHDAALMALVNKRFAAAFRDESTWRRRLAREEVVVPASVPTSASSMQRYQASAWRVHIVSLLEHQAGCSITQHFCVVVSPLMPMRDFLALVRIDERNQRVRLFSQ